MFMQKFVVYFGALQGITIVLYLYICNDLTVQTLSASSSSGDMVTRLGFNSLEGTSAAMSLLF